ncbi:MAG TPA: helix-turn-helix domain-containing protein [Pseudonocardiaceae bacterium]|nr:helix-turn-helix domain-containing protein [Pseudonocardiaceae bacterium]
MDPIETPSVQPDHLPAAAALAAAAALSDQLRRRMYGFIRQAHRPVSREEAAKTVGISRKLAAFHLDKLVEVGLLRAHYEPVGGIRKVGRTPKVYEPTNTEVRISIPAREHDLLAAILIDALLSQDQDKRGHEDTFQVARHRGAELGAIERERTRPGRLSAERALTLATAALTRYGFEPDRVTPTLLRLRNCPFAPLAAKAPQLVCGINHAFLTGFLDTLQASTLTAVLAPRAGWCCVELTTG